MIFEFLEECDLGQQSILHVVQVKPRSVKEVFSQNGGSFGSSTPTKLAPLCETLDDSMFSTSSGSRKNSVSIDLTDVNSTIESESGIEFSQPRKVHFYVYCPTCKDLKHGGFYPN